MTNAAAPPSPLPTCFTLDAYYETSIAVSRFKPGHLIVACNYQPFIGCTAVRKVFYGIDTNGLMGTTPFTETGDLPVPAQFPTAQKFYDPMTAASNSLDELWVGSVVNDGNTQTSGFAVWRTLSDTGTLEIGSPPTAETLAIQQPYVDDKGSLAVGPAFGAEHMYLGFARRFVLECSEPNAIPPVWRDNIHWARWDLDAPPSLLPVDGLQRIDPFPEDLVPPFCEHHAAGVAALVIPSGPFAGRLVVAYRRSYNLDLSPQNIETCFHNAPVASSAGVWGNAVVLLQTTLGEDIFGYSQDSIAGSVALQNYPSLAVDTTTSPPTVYAFFAGSADNPATVADQNVDIYVARSVDAGATFPSIIRITDVMLGDPEGTDQFFGVGTVDGFGGINLAYIKTDLTEAARPDMRIMYTRMASWNGPLSPDEPLALTPFFPCPMNPVSLGQRIGEYISIASSGCLIYVAYPQCEPEHGYLTTNVYVSRISVCPADTDDSGLVNIDDVATFSSAYTSQAAAADINRDGACTPTDIEAFLNAYTCGCGTP